MYIPHKYTYIQANLGAQALSHRVCVRRDGITYTYIRKIIIYMYIDTQ